MFKNFTSRVKDLIGGDLFSNISVLPFSKYRKNYSSGDFLNAYKISLYANKAINKRAEKVGQINFKLMKGDKEVEDNDLTKLLSKPNPNFTGNEFWELYQKYMDIFGSVYMLKDSGLIMGGRTRVNSLTLLRSDKVKPEFDEKTGELLRIEHKTTTATTIYQGSEVIYSHRPDPADMLLGESLLCSGIRQIETATQIDEYQSKILENGGRVEGVFNFKTDKLTREQLTQLKEKYQEEYGNASKAGLPMFLSGDASYEKLGLNPQELAYLETKGVLLTDIVILTGVPKTILGATSDETFSNADASIRIFLSETIKPLLESLTENLNENLIPDDLTLTFIDPTPEDKEEVRKDLESGIKNYYMTPNEARKAIGLDPLPNGNDLLAPMNVMPLSDGEVLEPTVEPIKEEIKSEYRHPLKSVDNRRIYHGLQQKRLNRRQDMLLDIMKSYFSGQKNRLIEKITAQKKFKRKDLLGDIFNQTLEIKLAKESVLPLLNKLLVDSAIDAKEIAGSAWDFNETADIQSWLDKKTSVFAERINETTFKKLKNEFRTSFDEGESRKELIGRIESTYGDISKGRAEVIARTEVHGVTQYGTIQGYQQAGMQIKIWVWAPGTRGGVRESHQAMDGEEKPMGTAFSNGLMFPGADGPAGEVINCECFI